MKKLNITLFLFSIFLIARTSTILPIHRKMTVYTRAAQEQAMSNNNSILVNPEPLITITVPQPERIRRPETLITGNVTVPQPGRIRPPEPLITGNVTVPQPGRIRRIINHPALQTTIAQLAIQAALQITSKTTRYLYYKLNPEELKKQKRRSEIRKVDDKIAQNSREVQDLSSAFQNEKIKNNPELLSQVQNAHTECIERGLYLKSSRKKLIEDDPKLSRLAQKN